MSTMHPYIKYAQALIMVENNLVDCTEITANQIRNEIEKGLDEFRVKPFNAFTGQNHVGYHFCKEEKGNTNLGVFLSPHVIATDQSASNTWEAGNALIQELQNNPLNNSKDIKMGVAPTSGEYLTFSSTGKIGRGTSKSTLLERGLSMITTLTKNKPSLHKGKPEMLNICLIPDLQIPELKDFISFFKRMLVTKTDTDLMIGKVDLKPTGKGKNKKNVYLPKRPLIFNGNFPNPPRSSALGSIALLGTIGEFAKKEEYSEQAKRVLESLRNAEIYLIQYGNATSFTYNHYVIDLAKEGKLKTIIDCLYQSKLYNQSKRSFSNPEYQKFDLFTSHFLQLFNQSAFKDFLAFRAEYPSEVITLFNTYFIKMGKIDTEIVKSAKVLGKWLNRVAYLTAQNEVKKDKPNYKEELRNIKAKVLIELESSTFSAKSGNALIAQAVTRAGRLSSLDVPEGATLFMEKAASEELPLDDAKNLLIAFSRLINKSEEPLKEEVNEQTNTEDEEDLNNE